MGDHGTLERGREAVASRAWGDAFQLLSEAGARGGLTPADLDRLATAAYLTGHADDAFTALERLHTAHLDRGETGPAARTAAWLALLLLQGGHEARGGGWLARAHRLIEEHALDGSERGLVLVPVALGALHSGDGTRAEEAFVEVAAVGARCDDHELRLLGLLGRGQARIALGDVTGGVPLLDEAMVAAMAGGVSPLLAGITYCAVIIACRDVFDLRRAEEWTAVLSRWCDTHEDLRPFRGQCLVHRSEILQLRGEWVGAMAEVESACAHLAALPGDPVLGMARYQQAELLRLRGRFRQAEQGYREASAHGHSPHPGLALLRLAQGRLPDAVAAIRGEMQAAGHDRVRRARIIAGYVEILLAADEPEAAAAGVEELRLLADEFATPYLEAVTAETRGALLLATDEPAEAGVLLRRARDAWQGLDARYEAARVRLYIARACRLLGDHDTAQFEAEAARAAFEQLGAGPAAEAARELSRAPAGPPGGLTPREMEVLRLVATGATNRQVAAELVISEKTVARHLSNLFTKLGVASRAAATAWAYEHELA